MTDFRMPDSFYEPPDEEEECPYCGADLVDEPWHAVDYCAQEIAADRRLAEMKEG